MTRSTHVDVTERSNPTNGGLEQIIHEMPYVVDLGISGIADMFFHRWTPEAIELKKRAQKGSAGKTTDDVESYVWRMDNGNLALPGEYLRQSLIHAAKFKQDPRSPRKSAMDLFKAGIVMLTPLADLGKPTWDYLDSRRVVVQRNGINRTRPVIRVGWRAAFQAAVALPEYIQPILLKEVLDLAGRLIGVADYRPTYGRFSVVKFDVLPPQ